MLTHSWRTSFFAGGKIASVRAGNVIGGGDSAADRLVPDLIRAFRSGTAAKIRNPASVRPWQFVLEPLVGYLMLAERLCDSRALAEGWNFGPDQTSVVSVAAIADRVAALWGKGACWEQASEANAPKESIMLQLDSTKARTRLQWQPVWPLDRALEATVAWYKSQAADADMAAVTLQQIDNYQRGLDLPASAA